MIDTAFEHDIVLEPRFGIAQIKRDVAVVNAVIINAARVECLEQNFFFHARAGIEYGDFHNCRLKIANCKWTTVISGSIQNPRFAICNSFHSPQSSSSCGARSSSKGFSFTTSSSAPQSGQTMISPRSGFCKVISASHSGQFADILDLRTSPLARGVVTKNQPPPSRHW